MKVASSDVAVAIIFGRAKSKNEKYSFVQVITGNDSFSINFDYNDFVTTKRPFSVRIGNNTISLGGANMDIVGLNYIKCRITFNSVTPIKYDAMGPFKFFPFMECKHKVISIDQKVSGSININGSELNFTNAAGYIEGDFGLSFPKKYFWSQCNKFSGIDNLSVMGSCGLISYLGFRFNGTICIINSNGREYRLATYLGARVRVFTDNKLVVKQRGKMLEIESLNMNKKGHELLAPNHGEMNRAILESVQTAVRFKFSIRNRILFDVIGDCAAFEYSRELLTRTKI